MRKGVLFFVLFCCSFLVLSQEDKPVIILNYENGKIRFENEGLDLRKNSSYFVELRGINSAHHIFKVEAKSFEVYSSLPEVLKPIFPGVKESSVGPIAGYVQGDKGIQWNEFSDDLEQIMVKLESIKRNADVLYKASKFEPRKEEAKAVLDDLHKLYKTKSNEDLSKVVKAEILKVRASAEVIKDLVANQKEINPLLVDLFIATSSYTQEIEEQNFLDHLNYIIRSTEAESYRRTKSAFKADKDLSELRLVLVDTYTEDTIFNGIETIYNYGGVGLAFSTGFFYTNGLSDKPYYLEARQDGKMAVKTDEEVSSDISIGGFGHVYLKVSPKIRIGPGIGLTYSPWDEKFRYLIGGGFLFGREKMMSLTAGIALAKVKQLSELTDADSEGLFLPAGATIIPTYNGIENSLFIGLTYNIATSKK